MVRKKEETKEYIRRLVGFALSSTMFILTLGGIFVTLMLNFMHIIASHEVSLPVWIIIGYTFIFYITATTITLKIFERRFEDNENKNKNKNTKRTGKKNR